MVDSMVLSIAELLFAVMSPLPPVLFKVFKRNALGPDLQCKSLILQGNPCKVFQAWDLAAQGAESYQLDMVLPPCLIIPGASSAGMGEGGSTRM
jgi:hypothetical protein